MRRVFFELFVRPGKSAGLLLALCLCLSIGLSLNACLRWLFHPGIYMGKEMFSKRTFYHSDDMTTVTHIVSGELDSDPGPDIGIFGQLSLHITDFHGRYKTKIPFGWEGGILEPAVRVKAGGGFEILACGQEPLGVMNQKGEPLWVHKTTSISSMTWGDINQDGNPEYYITSGVLLLSLDDKGGLIWKKKNSNTLYDVGIYPWKNKSFIITISHDGKLRFLDYYGKVVREIMPEQKIYGFRVCYWLGSYQLLSAHHNDIFLTDSDGKTVFRYELSGCPTDIYNIRATPVRFAKKTYLAVIMKFSSSVGLSMLCVFSPEKKLVYQELLKVTSGLLAVKRPHTDEDFLLVGDGPGKVSRYYFRD